MRFLKNIMVPLTVILLAVADPARAEEEDSPETKRCISLVRIDHIEVIDRQHILFHMRGKKTYLNTLPHRCPGLSKHRPIMYRTSTSQLCDLDSITVLQSIGRGYQPGASCGLGKFEPVTSLDAFRKDSRDKED